MLFLSKKHLTWILSKFHVPRVTLASIAQGTYDVASFLDDLGNQYFTEASCESQTTTLPTYCARDSDPILDTKLHVICNNYNALFFHVALCAPSYSKSRGSDTDFEANHISREVEI